MSKLSFIARGFNSSLWWRYYQYAQTGSKLKRTIFTLLYMGMASKDGGYVGRTTRIKSLPDLPHGFHGIHISRQVSIGSNCTIYQGVTVGG